MEHYEQKVNIMSLKAVCQNKGNMSEFKTQQYFDHPDFYVEEKLEIF